MVEVFKTNVKNRSQAILLINQIHKRFKGYDANFDLEDRDKILRVECKTENVCSNSVIDILNDFGFDATILDDEPTESFGGMNIKRAWFTCCFTGLT